MADVRWFRREYVAAVLRGNPLPSHTALGLNVPGPYSLANRLISGWALPGSDALEPWVGDQLPQVSRGSPSPFIITSIIT